MTHPRTYSLALLLGSFGLLASMVTGCGLDNSSDTPTWSDDAKPILLANCARCHSYPAIGGAPDSFRLDTYDDFVTADGQLVYGAATMAWNVALRTDTAATAARGVQSMPPQDASGQGLTERQIDILQRWYLSSDPRPARGAPPVGNRAPTIGLTRPLADSLLDGADGALTIDYEIRDPDRDHVIGELRAGPSFESGMRIGPLHSGRGQVVWDVGALEAGSYRLFARLDDGAELHDLELGTYDLTHADGNHAPSLLVTRPAPYEIIAAIDNPYSIALSIGDLDVDDALTVTISAIRENERIVVAQDFAVVGGPNQLPWDTTTLTEGAGWRLEVSLTDGTATRSKTTRPFRISQHVTNLGFADVAPALGQRCGVCHGSGLIPLDHDLASYDDVDGARGAYSMRGLIYRRAIEARNMPPLSHIVQSDDPAAARLEPAERALLEDWLLGGAPQ